MGIFDGLKNMPSPETIGKIAENVQAYVQNQDVHNVWVKEAIAALIRNQRDLNVKVNLLLEALGHDGNSSDIGTAGAGSPGAGNRLSDASPGNPE